MHDSILQIPADARYVDHTMIYRIAGNFRGRKHLWIGENYDFCRENFLRLLTFAVPKDAICPQILQRKLSWIATKPWNLWKFSPSKVSHCTVFCARKLVSCTCMLADCANMMAILQVCADIYWAYMMASVLACRHVVHVCLLPYCAWKMACCVCLMACCVCLMAWSDWYDIHLSEMLRILNLTQIILHTGDT